VEFVVSLRSKDGKPDPTFHLLQCRPQKQWSSEAARPIPIGLTDKDRIFRCTRMVPQGYVGGIEYILYVDPEAYFSLEEPSQFSEAAWAVGQLNRILEGKSFIMIGPGRWGSSDHMQGVPVTYADIFNTRALIELASQKGGYSSEPSYGTHFFQDLVEAQIYPLAICPEEEGDYLNQDFFARAANHIGEFLPNASSASRCVKLVHVPGEASGSLLDIAMDGQQGVAYLPKAP
jgi:hypothetical protein